jgi:hypothetical protein
MIDWKDSEGGGRGLILSYYPRTGLERMRKTTKISVTTASLRANF